MIYKLNNVARKLSANKLMPNNSKTEYMIIGSKKRLSRVSSDSIINVGNLEITRVENGNLPGLMIDESLSCSAHVQLVAKRSLQVLQFSEEIEK